MHLTIEPNEHVTFKIRHESPGLVVVDKPAGVVTQPGVGHQRDTLLNGLFARFGGLLQQLGAERDFGLVHRLDRETSGLVMVATTAASYDALREAFATRRVRKFYYAVCHKSPRNARGVVNRPIAEVVRRVGKYTSTKTAVVSGSRGGMSGDAKAAVTAYRVLSASDLGALIEARPITGRLHQVRVHLASIGAAILGDDLYGPARVKDAATRLALHAHRVVVEQPATGELVDVQSPLPKDIKKLLARLGLSAAGAKPDAGAAVVGPAGEPEAEGIDADEAGTRTVDDERPDVGHE